MNGTCNSTIFGPWGGAKGQISLNLNFSKSISKIFIPNFVCLLTNERYKTYIRRDFHTTAWVMPQGWDLGVLWGNGGVNSFSEIQPELVCELHKWHMQQHNFWVPHPLGPWGGAKGQISLNLLY